MVLLKPQDFVIITYEALVEEDPIAIIRAIYNTLEIPYTDLYHQTLTRYVDSLQGYQTNTFQLGPEAEEVISTTCRHIFDAYGYAL